MRAGTRARARPVTRARAGAATALIGLALSATSHPAAAASTSEAADAGFDALQPLPPSEAFVPAASFDGADTLRLDWHIEDGYYLYRDKMSVGLDGAAGLSLGALQHSEALIVTDDWFGEQATFRDAAITQTRLIGTPNGGNGTVTVTFQGCADIGLCYPPTTTTLPVSLPAAVVKPERLASSATGALGRSGGEGSALSGLFGGEPAASEPELLRPEEAYLPALLDTTTAQLTLNWLIEPGYYLYRDKLSADVVRADGARIENLALLALPDGQMQEDAFFGVTAVLRDRAEARYALPAGGLAVDEEAVLELHYQGCADIGVCFPPETFRVPFVATSAAPGDTLAAAPAPAAEDGAATGNAAIAAAPSTVLATTASATAASGSDDDAGIVRSEQDRLSALLASSSLWLSSLTFYGLGLLLAFTPCVLPMVPILSSLIVGQNRKDGETASRSGMRAFRLSAVYVLVMASTYALAGVLVAVSGANVQVWFQNPILLSAFAALFVLFALAMFGQYELQLPRALQARLTDASNAQQGRGYRGVITMGFLSTLIVGPCVTAPLVGALLFIADTGNALVGGVALFALGLGMGTPLLLVGTSAGSLLPRTGVWMVRVKQGFGILMLGMAIWMLSRFMDPGAIVLMTGLLALGSGIWLGATDRLDASTGGVPRLAKGAGLAVSLYGAAVLIGLLAGGDSLLRPLAVFNGGGSGSPAEQESELAFHRVKTLDELNRVVASSSAEGRPVMLDFYADWCISCKEMEAFTFTDERVQELLANVVTVQVDVTRNDADDKALLERFRLFAPPAIVFFDPAGNELANARVVGFQNAERFAEHVERTFESTVARR